MEEERYVSRRERLEDAEYKICREIRAIIEHEIGLHEIDEVTFDYDCLEEDWLTIHIGFYDEPKEGEISEGIDK